MESASPEASNARVAARIAALAPAANLGHRGTGKTRRGHPFPENSVAAFRAGMEAGADGVELDVELTADGALVVMHDDTLDRTTDGKGCVSQRTLDEVRATRLVGGDGAPLEEHPPSLAEAFAALPDGALVNVELKVFAEPCLTDGTGFDALAAAAVAEVERLDVGDRVLFSSFDPRAVAEVKRLAPHLYAALLLDAGPSRDHWRHALEAARVAALDAIHPHRSVPAAAVRAMRDAGLGVNVWTVNEPDEMRAAIDAGVTAIITDVPGVLRELLERR